MFVHVSSTARAAKKTSILMGIWFALSGSIALLLTMHVYVKRSNPPPPGFRFFGFPRARPEDPLRSRS